jgi:hypothetical protein
MVLDADIAPDYGGCKSLRNIGHQFQIVRYGRPSLIKYRRALDRKWVGQPPSLELRGSTEQLMSWIHWKYIIPGPETEISFYQSIQLLLPVVPLSQNIQLIRRLGLASGHSESDFSQELCISRQLYPHHH